MILLLALNTPAYAAAVSGSPWHSGPIIQRFFLTIARVDGAPVLREEWRCWTGTEWMPLDGAECTRRIFGKHPLEPVPKHQRRME